MAVDTRARASNRSRAEVAAERDARVPLRGRMGTAWDGETSVEEAIMANRINRAIELLAGDQAIYYVGGHSGHVLTRAQGRADADTWADYINIGMEHGSFDMA